MWPNLKSFFLLSSNNVFIIKCLHLIKSCLLITYGMFILLSLLTFSSLTGSLPSMVDPASEGGLFPDIQFWKQCADPVLAQDPFSSLMSALFCLPVQFLSSAEFFIPFVHLFYVVCAIQVCCFALLPLYVCSLYVSCINS